MKKKHGMLKRFLCAAVSLTLLPLISSADTIVLKDGQSIEADKIDEREGDLFFYLHGMKMRVSKAAVLRIIKSKAPKEAPAAASKGKAVVKRKPSKREGRAKKIIKVNPLPSEHPAALQTEKSLPAVRSCGLRDLYWGSGRSAVGLLQEAQSGTGQVEIKEYVRANEDLKLGKAQLDSIIYAFWRHKLYAVTIWATGHANYLALRNEIFRRFGVGLKSDQHTERYLWSDTYSDRMLKYIAADQSGLFWMRSKDLNRMYQLSQIKTPSTYLKAMDANALRTD